MTTILLSLTVAAQRYPVTVTPTLLPPYTLNLSELTAPASARLMATITVNDLTASNLPVRLHFKLESNDITIESIKTAAVAPLFLGGGETLVLTGSDMAQYLRLDNLDFRGYSKEQYRQTGQLPGGMWRLTIEAHHFHNHRVLSNRGTATVWVSIYDPPELTAPRNGTEAPDNPSLPLIFNWQPSKHTGGTEAVQYRLQVWEMRMQGVPAQTVAASMSPIFETTTAATTYTAIPAAMNLEPGMQYCWRVTVFDPSGKALINKNGQSEVREFTYLHTCPAVDEVTATVHNARVDFSWTPAPYHTHFQVELVGDNGVSELNDCYDSQFKLYDFPRGSTWKVRVRGECSGGLEADWSPWSDFEIDPPGTPPTPEECPNCGCEDAPAKRNITNYELKELHEGDTIENRTGRTRFIVLTAVPNGDGSYNGQFYIWLELWKTKVRCDYTDLKVNTDGVIFDGQWRSVRNDGLMVNPAAVAEAIESIKNNVAAATYDNYIRDTVKFTYPIQTIYKDQNDNYIAILKDGTELDVTQRLSNAGHTLIEDSEGNQMAVTGDHRLMSAEQYHKTGKNSTLLKNDSQAKDKQIAASGEVIFKPSGNQQYGFDAYDASTNNHPEIYPPLEDGSYRPAYKSVAQWQQDKVAADPMQGVTFRNQMGVPYATTSGDIILRGEPQPGETPVYAHMAETDSTTKVVGKLNLLTFEPREISVCLVPVNGATPPNAQTLEKELNKIFKPAVASVKLSTATPINIQYANGENFVHGGSGLLSVYSEDEKNAIKALQNVDNETYYLFVVDNATRLNPDGTAMRDILAGYMPIGYQCGFLFGSPAAKYVAHELGHGAFGLHHTFSSETESFNAPQYSTDNLMDYADGTTLNHKQWTWMHEKHGSGLFGFLADEDESESARIYNAQEVIDDIIEKLRCAKASNRNQIFVGSNSGNLEAISKTLNVKVECVLKNYKKYNTYTVSFPYEKTSYNNYRDKYDFGDIYMLVDIAGSEAFRNHIDNDRFDSQKNDIQNSLGKNDTDAALRTLFQSSYCVFEKLSNDNRMKLVKGLSEQWTLPECDENMVLNLLRASAQSADDAKKVLNYVFDHNSKIFKSLNSGMSDFNGYVSHSEFMKLLVDLYVKAYKEDLELGHFRNSSVAYVDYWQKDDIGSNIQLLNGVYKWICTEFINDKYNDRRAFNLPPQQIITIVFRRDVSGFKSGDVVAMPMFYYAYLMNENLSAFKAEALDNLLFCISVLKAVGAVGKGIKAGLTLSGILTVGDAVLEYMNRVIETNETELNVWFKKYRLDYEDFSSAWDNFSKLYKVASNLNSIASNLQGGSTIKLLYDGLDAISMYMSESSKFTEKQIKDCKTLREQVKTMMDDDVIH
ncbi:MAG: hypothetical protein J6T12_01570 [Salinivirgaceae bacterium]|nr:hypothetical protein [Salinivirgaceae bacterium]